MPPHEKHPLVAKTWAFQIPDGIDIDFFNYQLHKLTSLKESMTNELAWLHRFPFLENFVFLASEQNDVELKTPSISNSATLPTKREREHSIRIPFIKHPHLPKSKVILPLGFAAPMTFPDGLRLELPDYMHSALTVYHGGEWFFFDRDYTSSSNFWEDFKKNSKLMDISGADDFFWGIIILAEKLPHPIAISREISFHLGYNDQLLPQYLNLSLSTRCNIRCTICGTQNSYKEHGIKGHIIDTKFLLKIAETFFPYLETVEINSFGEQLLYEDFPILMELLNKYGCQFKLQTNGTFLPDHKLKAILKSVGTVSFSIDAIGAIFESQRVGAKWNEVEANVLRLLAKRDPNRIKVSLYPTITRKTLPCVLDLCQWAENSGIDALMFHYYNPIQDGIEERPSFVEQKTLLQTLQKYAEREKPSLLIILEGQQISQDGRGFYLRNPYFSKYGLKKRFSCTPHMPRTNNGLYAKYICLAPLISGNITPDGYFFPGCCSLWQRTSLCPTNDHDFFSLWFGSDLNKIRNSLTYDIPHPPMLQECQKCISSLARSTMIKH